MIDLIFELNYFKPKISAFLKRYCCHRNGSRLTFVRNLNPLDAVIYLSKILFVLKKYKFSIFFKTVSMISERDELQHENEARQ